jgi:phage-related protein
MSDFTTWCPAPPMSSTSEWRMNIAQYGDGYEMRALDGINALNETFDLDYGLIPQGQIEEMQAYLIAQGARAFPFRHPVTGFLISVFCDSWDVEYSLVQWVSNVRTVYGTLSVEFRKANGVGEPA